MSAAKPSSALLTDGGEGEVEAWQLPVAAATLSAMYIQHTHKHTHTDAQGFHGVHWVNRAATAAFAIVAI